MIRAREAEADEVMRTRHDLVMELRIQEALEAGGEGGAPVGSESGVNKAAAVVIHDGKVTQDFAGRKNQGGAKFMGAKFQADILCFAAAYRAFGFVRHREKTTTFLIFVDGAVEKTRQGVRHLCLAEIRDRFLFGHCSGFLEAV